VLYLAHIFQTKFEFGDTYGRSTLNASIDFRRSRVARSAPSYRYSHGLSAAFKGDLIDEETLQEVQQRRATIEQRY
jgi:hypothetical protein